MIKIITKSTLAAFVLLAVAGAASAAPDSIDPWTKLPGAQPVTPINVLSTNGSFSYKKKLGSKGKPDKIKMSYKAKGSKGGIFLRDIGMDGSYMPGNKLVIQKGKINVKKGKIKISGIDPLNKGGSKGSKKVVLVKAYFDESAGVFGKQGGYDLFGVTTTKVDCPEWSFCTKSESFYVAGDFGNNLNKIKVKGKGSKGGGATAVTTIPVPAAVWLFGSGLIGLVGVARRRKHS